MTVVPAPTLRGSSASTMSSTSSRPSALKSTLLWIAESSAVRISGALGTTRFT